jgi:prephenate dehydratase
VGEVVLRVVHCLIGLRTANLQGIKTVYSHPQALAQCRNFVKSLGAEPRVTYDTAGSVKMIKEGRLDSAGAIAGERSAEIYGLKVLKKGVEDYSTNSTRFLIISREGGKDHAAKGRAVGPRADVRPRGISLGSKTSLMFAVPHTPGSLYNALEVFAREKINLTKIESRPTKERPWEYYFFVDFQGHRDDAKVVKVISALAEKAAFLKVLGSYPRSKAAG